MSDNIIDIELPIHRELPARKQPLRAIYVSRDGSGIGSRLAQMVIESNDRFLFQFQDDWLCVDDLQAICDAAQIRTGRVVESLTVNHAMRRAIILLTSDHKDDGITSHVPTPAGNLVVRGVVGNPDVAIIADRDFPSRMIRVTVVQKEAK